VRACLLKLNFDFTLSKIRTSDFVWCAV